MSAPFATTCSNDHFDARWTCPACYTDLPTTTPGLHRCPACGATVECYRASFVSCVAELVATADAEAAHG